MPDYTWVEEATESTVAMIETGETADAVLSRLGATEAAGELTFATALELQGSLFDDDTAHERAVFQIARLNEWWVTVEPNGYRASLGPTLVQLAAGGQAASFFWNVNAVMSVVRVEAGEVRVEFDPLTDEERVPPEGADLDFGLGHPRAAAFTLLERWTGVRVTEEWFNGPKPTFLVVI